MRIVNVEMFNIYKHVYELKRRFQQKKKKKKKKNQEIEEKIIVRSKKS